MPDARDKDERNGGNGGISPEGLENINGFHLREYRQNQPLTKVKFRTGR
jgi:hypothetical protein